MKKRPTIALACIVKNEAINISSFLQSIEGCFDEIHITDTGSTDNTVELFEKEKSSEIARCPIYVHHFEWVKDFSKARQYSFDQVPKEIDFIMWLDLDDVLSDKEKFIHFRDYSLHCAHMWLNPYNYAFNKEGQPSCAFMRERIVKNNHGFKWQFFLHEGLVRDWSRPTKSMPISTWTVNHRRTEQDLANDKGRNLNIFESNLEHEDMKTPRMKYYYGKELHDAGKHLEAIEWLNKVITEDGKVMEPHDRIMAIQYLAMAYGACDRWSEALQMCLQGMQLDPGRAEYWILAGDANYKMGRVSAAVNYYDGAKRGASSAVGGMTFTDPSARNLYPYLQIAAIAQNSGNHDLIMEQALALEKMGFKEAEGLKARADSIKHLSIVPKIDDLQECEDVVITCPPQGACQNWDEHSLEREGTGGSETAAIEIARWIKKKTGRPVKIFQPRSDSQKMPSGVEYYPCSKTESYIKNYKPKAHIAWRHATRLTPVDSYVWSHDLITHGGERHENYEKYLCLSGFHKEFVIDQQSVPEEKIALVSNGVNPLDFEHLESVEKIPGKVIFSSSPDRGMERCIEICKRAKERVPDLELHLFYGFRNMRLAGANEEADRLENLIAKNSSFVKFHGMTDKKTLMKHFKESVCWLYPADFIETYCITAIEALATGAYPLVRNIGALPYTLWPAYEMGMCTILDEDADSVEKFDVWADELVKVIDEKLFERVNINIEDYSWEKAADGFIQLMGL